MQLITGKRYLVNASPIMREEDWCEMVYKGYERMGMAGYLHHFEIVKDKPGPKTGSQGFGTKDLTKVKEL